MKGFWMLHMNLTLLMKQRCSVSNLKGEKASAITMGKNFRI
jgi:hypothetical protein